MYREIKEHGVTVVLPSEEEAAAWLHDVKEQCLDHFNDCLKGKAQAAAKALNEFR